MKQPHPSYGFLTEEELKEMSKALPMYRDRWLKMAREREKQWKKQQLSGRSRQSTRP